MIKSFKYQKAATASEPQVVCIKIAIMVLLSGGGHTIAITRHVWAILVLIFLTFKFMYSALCIVQYAANCGRTAAVVLPRFGWVYKKQTNKQRKTNRRTFFNIWISIFKTNIAYIRLKLITSAMYLYGFYAVYYEGCLQFSIFIVDSQKLNLSKFILVT